MLQSGHSGTSINPRSEAAIKALKRKVAHEGIYKELKRRRFYEKPSVKRKRKQREAERRRRKERRRALRAQNRRR